MFTSPHFAAPNHRLLLIIVGKELAKSANRANVNHCALFEQTVVVLV